jgi:hypothetical protein
VQKLRRPDQHHRKPQILRLAFHFGHFIWTGSVQR